MPASALFISDLPDTLTGPAPMADRNATAGDPDDDPTTLATGEEGDDGPQPTTVATGEEGDDDE
ncbi:hypothetical protein ACFV6D_38415 [Kitasatospora sp. NPDC059812]|uniref:hypothetical protein n=1 Tax=Kitasatospora sp. NPDC059812 TaxID=3346958 RepID=UPI003665CF69